MQEDTKEVCDAQDIHKEQLFTWTDEKVARVSKIIRDEYNSSEIWSGDYTAELNIIKKFKLDTILEQKLSNVIVKDIEDSEILIVDKREFGKLIDFLTTYQTQI